MIARLRNRLTYANVVATLAVFLALGGTSYAVLHVGSDDVVDNSLRSTDIRNNTLRGRDVRDRTLRSHDIGRDKLGAGVIKESTLRAVPRATDADRLGGVTAQDLRLKCPPDTVARAGVCIESSARAPQGFLTASDICDQVGRGLATMAQLDRYARLHGPLPRPEWTGSVYRNTGSGSAPLEQLEAVVLEGGGNVSYDRIYFGAQHGFRCVALASN